MSLPESSAVACIFWGEKFDTVYLTRLFDAVRRNSPLMPFVCLTDRTPPPEIGMRDIRFIKTPSSYKGWWQKLHLFDREIMGFDHLLYFDLDSVILKSLDPLLDLLGNQDFAYAEDPVDPMSSSLMLIDTRSAFAREVTNAFDPIFLDLEKGTDQNYFSLFLNPVKHRLKKLPPSTHLSYKHLINHLGCQKNEYAIPELEETVSLNFHGWPKPWDVEKTPEFWKHSETILTHWR